MKVGVSSQNFRTITGHAGKSRRFLVYELREDGVHELERIDLPKEMSLHAFSGTEHPLFDLDIIVTAGCGEGFVRRMSSHDVHVVATAEIDPKATVEKLLAGKDVSPAAHEH